MVEVGGKRVKTKKTVYGMIIEGFLSLLTDYYGSSLTD